MTSEPSSIPDEVVHPPEPQETAAERTFRSAKSVVRTVQLDDVRFGAFSAQGFEAGENIPADAKFNISTRFLRPTLVRVSEQGFVARTTLVFHLGGKLADDSQSRYAVVQATLDAEYAFKADSPAVDEGELKDFALCYCPFHVWGYWREFVQSSLARLDLPQVTLPLFLIDQALSMVRDHLE